MLIIKRRNSFFLLLFFIFFSCSQNQKKFSLTKSNYTIDLDEKKEASIPFSTFFKNPKTITLETNREFLIGHIKELQVFNGCIYILDALYAKSLFVFNMDGHFIKKIGSLGNGPGEYIQPLDFTFDTENRFIFLLDYGNRVHQYHLDGIFVRTITLQEQDIYINNIQYYNEKLYLSVRKFQPSTNDYMLMEVDIENGKILSSLLPLKYNKGWAGRFSTGHSFFMSRLNDPPRFTHLYMDYIVTIGDVITPFVELKSKYLTTYEDVKKLQGDKKTPQVFEEAIMQIQNIWDVNSFIENVDFIIFRYRDGFRDYNTVIIHKKTEMVELVKYLNNDLIYKNDNNGLYRNFAFSDTKGVYEIIQVPMIEKLQESIKNNNVAPGLDKMDELLKLEKDNNPVIFYYEFK